MFNKRHEHELAEIRALTHELTGRFQEILDRLKGIEEAQRSLAARGPETPGKAGSSAETAHDTPSEPDEAAPSKRERRMQAAAAVGGDGINGDATGKRGRKKRRAGSPAAQNPSVEEE